VPIDTGTGEVVVGDGAFPIWVIDTDAGSITGYDDLDPEVAMTEEVRPAGRGDAAGIELIRVPGGETGYAVFAVDRFEVAEAGWLIGTGRVPLVILAATEIRVAGVITVGADRVPGHDGPGAGGFGGAPGGEVQGFGPGGGGPGVRPSTTEFAGSGGAGGTFGSIGGSGGPLSVVPGGAPADPYGSVELNPLIGGSGGGGGGGVPGARGGPGGGALQLTAGRRLVLEGEGIIDAGGGGGFGLGPGGGGGSGGALLIEAPVVELRGFVGANGGAGGHDFEEQGEGGWAARVPALGRPSQGGSVGGSGAGSDVAGEAGSGLPSGGSSGGGGGGAGRIRIQTAAAVASFPDALITPRLDTDMSTTGPIATE
jgi:hypothetical protein